MPSTVNHKPAAVSPTAPTAPTPPTTPQPKKAATAQHPPGHTPPPLAELVHTLQAIQSQDEQRTEPTRTEHALQARQRFD